jgi:hypothetical protein
LGYNPKEPLIKILFAIGIAVSTLLLTSCSNPDTSGGVTVTMSRDNANEFPDGSCEGQGQITDGLKTGCGWIYLHEKGYYILPDADLSHVDLRGADLMRADLMFAHLSGADLSGADLSWANLSDADLRGAKTWLYLRVSSLTICPNGRRWGTADNNCGF